MATITVVPEVHRSRPKLIAPRWHTGLLVALFVGLTIGGAFFQKEARSQPGTLPQHPQVLPLYLSLIATEWGLFFYVWKGGLRRTGTKLADLIGGNWRRPKEVAVDAGLALGLWIAWMLVEKGWDRFFGPSQAASVQTFLPRRALFGLIALWRGSLRPGMIAHSGADILSGIFGI